MRFFDCLIALFGFAAMAGGHVVPNMTIETDFAANRDYTLRINLDPRVFLSDQPTSLPPVSADWYLGQTEAEKQATYAKATDYLKANVGLTFNDETTPLPPCEFVALDGGTYEAVKPETVETHLLATAKARVPEGAESFKIAFGRNANVSLILLNSEEGGEERKAQVIFPGETSRPFQLTQIAAPEKPDIQVTEMTVTRVYPGAFKAVLIIGITMLLLFALGVFFIKRSKR